MLELLRSLPSSGINYTPLPKGLRATKTSKPAQAEFSR